MKWVHITSITICEPVNLPVKKSEWKPSLMKILSTSTSPSKIYGQINLPVEITTPSNLGPSTIPPTQVDLPISLRWLYPTYHLRYAYHLSTLAHGSLTAGFRARTFQSWVLLTTSCALAGLILFKSSVFCYVDVTLLWLMTALWDHKKAWQFYQAVTFEMLIMSYVINVTLFLTHRWRQSNAARSVQLSGTILTQLRSTKASRCASLGTNRAWSA